MFITLCLHSRNHLQGRAKALVLNNLGAIYRLHFIEGSVGKADTAMFDLKTTVWIVAHRDPFA
ncbi:MAG: hypothetical protein OER56_02070, partial [Hyphomicrobiales bacterium]|nr:hypothetical protein [Hyphomicrobiales bacterium]